MERVYNTPDGRKALLTATKMWNCPKEFESQMLYSDAIKIAEIERAHEKQSGSEMDEKKGDLNERRKEVKVNS